MCSNEQQATRLTVTLGCIEDIMPIPKHICTTYKHLVTLENIYLYSILLGSFVM